MKQLKVSDTLHQILKKDKLVPSESFGSVILRKAYDATTTDGI